MVTENKLGKTLMYLKKIKLIVTHFDGVLQEEFMHLIVGSIMLIIATYFSVFEVSYALFGVRDEAYIIESNKINGRIQIKYKLLSTDPDIVNVYTFKRGKAICSPCEAGQILTYRHVKYLGMGDFEKEKISNNIIIYLGLSLMLLGGIGIWIRFFKHGKFIIRNEINRLSVK